jgi:hypothetical protein
MGRRTYLGCSRVATSGRAESVARSRDAEMGAIMTAKTLLKVICQRGRQDVLREGDAEACRQDLGVDQQAFDLLADLDERAILARDCSVGSLKLSPTGRLAAEIARPEPRLLRRAP